MIIVHFIDKDGNDLMRSEHCPLLPQTGDTVDVSGVSEAWRVTDVRHRFSAGVQVGVIITVAKVFEVPPRRHQ